MIVWGGVDASNERSNTGGRYDPATDSWMTTSAGSGAPSGRGHHSAVWTGTEMIVWGGIDDGYLNTGGRYDLATGNWTPVSTGAGVPTARHNHTAVWTGSEMIVWGGWDGGEMNSGGRYDPLTDSWNPTSEGTGVPTERYFHTTVWTGTEMIVWGGYPALAVGARYNPSSDSWTATSAAPGVPTRTEHVAVWTGTKMIVWGGNTHVGLSNTGGSYEPLSDGWTPTSEGTGVPARRVLHTAAWTGTEMIVWGGWLEWSFFTNTGGRYDPLTDSWTGTSTGAGVPTARSGHTGVWTGAEMIVWGGNDGSEPVSSGGLYDAASGIWTATSTGSGVPTARSWHSAIWTGAEMIVWGGNDGSYTNDGGLYCACDGDTVSTWYPDADSDGYGAGSTGIPSCSQPPGYISVGGDCDDTNADTYAGATEINDGLDNQCPGDPGYGIVDEISNTCGFHNAADKNEFSWTAQSGATSYEVARSTDAQFVTDCTVTVTGTTQWIDSEPVPIGACFHYLVRALGPNSGSWGADSAGLERMPVCP